MKGIFFLLIILSISAVFLSDLIEPDTFEIGEDKDITDINKDFMTGDILEPIITRSAIISGKLWTSPVPYVLNSNLEINAKGVILKAMEQFRLKTCIDFKPREAETYYLSIQNLNGCQSFVGQQEPDGQMLSIGQNCDTVAIVEHELLHALGFYHEQSRFDRDEYVTIITENIEKGREQNFRIVESSQSTTNGVEYDYLSVMHYGAMTFNNGTGNTINTTDPAFQDVIGQRLDMSPRDILELNLLYSCNSTIAFQMFCGFISGSTCNMTKCSQSELQWEMVTSVSDGPASDHTYLPSGSGDSVEGEGYFMHVNTGSGQEGDSAWLETNRMSPKRDCHIQCLQFYYYHSGNEGDQLNIWMREFDDKTDTKGTARLMGQITGPATSHWKLHHVSLNATKHFQVEFEVLKGTGNSTGGFSIDDINLSDTQCPHGKMQIDDLENRLENERNRTILYSQRQYSPDGYAYRVAVILNSQTFLGLYVQLVSGVNDDMLEWPCPYRQVTLKMLDQNPNIQLQMSKQITFTTDPERIFNGLYLYDNPRKNGSTFIDENNEVAYGGFLSGRRIFLTRDDLKFREFIKGGSGIFTFSFEDINPLFLGNELPCPAVEPVTITHSHNDNDDGPCFTRMFTTIDLPPSTTSEKVHTSSSPTLTTKDKRMFTTTDLPPTTASEKMYNTTSPPAETTEGKRMFTTTDLPPSTTSEKVHTSSSPTLTTKDKSSLTTTDLPPTTTYEKIHTSSPPTETTEDKRIITTTDLPPTTTSEKMYNTTSPPAETTEGKRMFTTTDLPPSTTSEKVHTSSSPTLTTKDKRMFTTTDLPPTTASEKMYNTTSPPAETTEGKRMFTTTDLPPSTTSEKVHTSSSPTLTTKDKRMFTTTDLPPTTASEKMYNTTSPPAETTEGKRMFTTTDLPPSTTSEKVHTSSSPTLTTKDKSSLTTTDLPPATTYEKIHTSSPPTETTEDKRIITTTDLPPTTTSEKMYTPSPPTETTEDESIFNLSPTMGACPVLIFPLALMLLLP
ncbi:meprin A subunit beta-like isoform X5 [Gouania willdenowi]|uniref:meprin A subunit beta-like isoform X3 n=1 Tax=Gouania willdenowi TaxID=441366 RepID=UPI0010557082|nr:meprin A subunit beta-like isoform X3 [Gouania willdenowi]XP_028326432.1 meprin A subunit beta-like isoform X5 [Gouania willdenowi]